MLVFIAKEEGAYFTPLYLPDTKYKTAIKIIEKKAGKCIILFKNGKMYDMFLERRTKWRNHYMSPKYKVAKKARRMYSALSNKEK